MDSAQTDVAVLGAGPGGYAAAFYAADRGKKVILIEREPRLGGVCLNQGCIPSKALLQATELIGAAKASSSRGITFAPPAIDLARLRAWKESILQKLAGGLGFLAKKRGVEVIRGPGRFVDAQTLEVRSEQGSRTVRFQNAVIATGSRAAQPAGFDFQDPRIMTSREALDLADVPNRLLIVGGGYIGMELGTVYAALGSQVAVVEMMGSILPGADDDLVRPVLAYAQKAFQSIQTGVRVRSLSPSGSQIKAVFEPGSEEGQLFDRVLVAVGRVPNVEELGLPAAGVALDERGFIRVNAAQQTSNRAIYAIGDVAGGLLLAHKAAREARLAVDAILGDPAESSGIVWPAVVFTHPEIAWCGLTESEANRRGITVQVARFPWAASGRAMTHDRPEGLTKLLVDPVTEKILGVGIVGFSAGELIAEGVLAVQMGLRARDLARIVHPHPTLSETLMECAELFYGHATHFQAPRPAAAAAPRR